MEGSDSRVENGTRKSAPAITNLDTSRSIRRSILVGEDSPRSHEKVSSSPLSTIISERVLSRSRSGPALDSGTPWCKYYAGTLLLSVVGVVVVSSSAFCDWGVQCLDWPFASTSGNRNGGMGSFGLVGNSINSMGKETAHFEKNQNVDGREKEYMDENCWSRSRHLFYRPEDRRFPSSSALRRSLLEYEALHARCTVGRTWKSVADLQLQNAEGHCKYLIYVEGWEGLGNRLLSLVSAFAFALATNRVLLIDSRGHLQDLLCEPFNTSSWKLPQEFPYDKVRDFPNLENVEKYENASGINLNLRHQQSERDQMFFCHEIQESLNRVQWIAWNSNQYYIPRLLMIPSFWARLNPLFPDPHHAFSQLVRYLCLPENRVWTRTERTYEAYLSTSRRLVGLQIRDPLLHNVSNNGYQKLMHCLLGADILPNVSRHNYTPPLSRRRNHSTERTTLFVASMHPEYLEALRDFYIDHDTEDGSLVSVYSVAYEREETYSYDSTVKAYIDIWLLSFSDTLVTTSWSTFGYIAQGLGGIRPYIIELKATSPPFCFSGQSIEPCNHYPFLSTCGTTANLSREHESWVNAHLRQCQDEWHGRQIV